MFVYLVQNMWMCEKGSVKWLSLSFLGGGSAPDISVHRVFQGQRQDDQETKLETELKIATMTAVRGWIGWVGPASLSLQWFVLIRATHASCLYDSSPLTSISIVIQPSSYCSNLLRLINFCTYIAVYLKLMIYVLK